MDIYWIKSKWEAGHLSLPEFFAKCREDGFDGVEFSPCYGEEKPAEVMGLLKDFGLKLVAQIHTSGKNPEEHLQSLEQLVEKSLPFEPLFINSHTGKDWFPFEENCRIFQKAQELEQKHGVTLVHETHRGRALYSAPDTERFLKVFASLRLTADFSHWMTVHESDLSDQPETVHAAVLRAYHLHGRIGYHEGPQVNDPAAPEWDRQRGIYVGWWQQAVDLARAAGRPWITLTPEFGPPPYMPTLAYTRQPVADPWTVNVWMKDFLKSCLKA